MPVCFTGISMHILCLSSIVIILLILIFVFYATVNFPWFNEIKCWEGANRMVGVGVGDVLEGIDIKVGRKKRYEWDYPLKDLQQAGTSNRHCSISFWSFWFGVISQYTVSCGGCGNSLVRGIIHRTGINIDIIWCLAVLYQKTICTYILNVKCQQYDFFIFQILENSWFSRKFSSLP